MPKEENLDSLIRSHVRLGTRLRQYALRSKQGGKPGDVSPRATLRPQVKASMKLEAAKKATTPKPPPAPRQPVVKQKTARGVVPPHLKQYLFKPRGK